MKKSGWMIALLMFGCLLTVGCHKEESYDMRIYYLNSEETALNTEGYNLKSDKVEGQVQEVLKKMRNPKDSVECVSAIPTDLIITDIRLEDGRLDLYFSEDYDILDVASEALMQAAERVQFHVADVVLKDHHGNEVGYLRSEDFVQK